MKKPKIRKSGILLAVIVVLFIILTFYSDNYKEQIETAVNAQQSIAAEEQMPIEQIRGATLGIITVLPPLLAVVIAFVTREVITSLLVGLLSGFFILSTLNYEGPLKIVQTAVSTVSYSCEAVIGVVGDYDNAAIILLCFAVGGLVAVINKTGGFKSLAEKLIQKIHTPKGANYAGELLGCLVFFDDYANSLIIGPVMQPVIDGLKMSREKLAFIVDTTAAPVAGMAVISSWVAAEIGIIATGLEVVGVDASAYNLFLGSIPFCFYNIFCLIFMFCLTTSGREYGPMLKAERKARKRVSEKAEPMDNVIMDMEVFEVEEHVKTNPLTAIVPILLLLVISFVGFYINGKSNSIAMGDLTENAALSFDTIRIAIGNSDTAGVMFMATIVASVAAILLGCLMKTFSFKEGVEVWMEGVKSLLLTVVILVLSWAMANGVQELGTCYYIIELVKAGFPYWFIPTLVFIICCLISFGVGSYGTMFIAMPIVIPVAYSFYGEASLIANQDSFISMCIACVLAGAIFGDHCSPITDTTILSSIGAGCNNVDHVRTQLPYALTVAAISVLGGTLPAGLGLPPIVSILIGTVFCIIAIRMLGKKVVPDET